MQAAPRFLLLAYNGPSSGVIGQHERGGRRGEQQSLPKAAVVPVSWEKRPGGVHARMCVPLARAPSTEDARAARGEISHLLLSICGAVQ